MLMRERRRSRWASALHRGEKVVGMRHNCAKWAAGGNWQTHT